MPTHKNTAKTRQVPEQGSWQEWDSETIAQLVQEGEELGRAIRPRLERMGRLTADDLKFRCR